MSGAASSMTADDQRLARRIERRVLRFIEANVPVRSGEPLLLAVSGGPDSLALLHIIAGLRPRLGVNLVAAYIDHRIRPASETEADRSFVASEARRLEMTFVSGYLSGGAAATRRSPEEAARQGRYRALGQLARESGARLVATGHTRTDQAETVLLRLLRGTGLRGLAAMAPVAAWPVPGAAHLALIRPLLTLDRKETIHYCAALGLSPRGDPENNNPRYLRNRVRASVLPELRALNPKTDAVLARLAEEAQAWREAIGDASPAAEQSREAPRPCTLDLDTTMLRSWDPAARLAALRSALQTAVPGRPAPSRAHLTALDTLVGGPSGRSIDLPRGVRAWREGDLLRIGSDHSVDRPALGDDLAVPAPGELRLPGWLVRTSLVSFTVAGGEDPRPWAALLNPAAIGGLTVGRRRPDDRIALGGMTGRKRLQDLFVDAKVPRGERDTRPVFRTERGVVWVAGLRVAGWAAAQGEPAVRVEVERVPPDACCERTSRARG